MKVGFKSNTIDRAAKVDTVEKPNRQPKAEDLSADDVMNDLFTTGLEDADGIADPFSGIKDYMFGVADETGFTESKVPDVDVVIERFRERFDRNVRKSEIDAIIDKYKRLVYEEIPDLEKALTDSIESGELNGAELAIAVQHRGALVNKEAEGLRALDKLATIMADKIKVGASEREAMWDLDGDGTIDELIGFQLDDKGLPGYFDLQSGTFIDIIPNLNAQPKMFEGNVNLLESDQWPTLEDGAPIPDTVIQLRDPADTANYDGQFASNNDFATSYMFTPPDTIYVRANEMYGPDLKVEEGNDYDPTYRTFPWSVDGEGNIVQEGDFTGFVQVQVAEVKVYDLYDKRYYELYDKGQQLITRFCGVGTTTFANVGYGKDIGGGQRQIDFSMVGFGVDASEGLLHKKYDFIGIESYTRHILSDDISNFDIGEVANTFGLTPPVSY